MLRPLALGVTLAVAGPAIAEDKDKDESSIKPALTAGLVELIGVPEPAHLGLYINVMLDVGIQLNPDWMLIPSVGIEFAPDNGHWGGTFFLIVDRYLTEVGGLTLTLEPQLGLIHDAGPDGDGGFDHAYFLAGGVGLAIIAKRFMWIPQIIASWGTQGEGWAISPVLFFSVPF